MGLLAALCMIFAAAGVGYGLLDRFGATGALDSFWSRAVYALLLGWIVLALGTLALGLAGLCNRPALGVFLALTAAVGLRGWSALIGAERRRFDRLPEGASPPEFGVSGWLTAGGLLLYVIAVPYAMTPAVESDELRYHLAAPEAYLEAGRIFYLPYQAYTNFPFLTEMLFTMAMALEGAEGAKLIHLSFLELSAILVALFAFVLARLGPMRSERRFARNAAATAGLAFASIPTALLHSAWAFVDLAAVAYFLAVAHLGLLSIVGRRRPPAWLLGAMAGGAIGVKYSMLPAMFVAVALLAMLMRGGAALTSNRRSGAIAYLARASIFAALVASPWFVKNAYWTGNPVYPLAHGLFDGGEWSESNARFQSDKMAEWGWGVRGAALAHGMAPGDRRRAFYESAAELPEGFAGRAIELALSPLTTSIAPLAFHDNFLGPAPLMAMALAAAGGIAILGSPRRRRRGARAAGRAFAWAFGLIVAYGLVWFFTYQSSRLLLPSLALVAALGGWGGAMLFGRTRERPFERAVAGASAAFVAGAILYASAHSMTTIVNKPGPRWALGLGFGDRESYLIHNVSYYDAARRLSQSRLNRPSLAPAGDRVLAIGEHRALYFDNRTIVNDWFDTPQPAPHLRATADNDEMLDRWLDEGVRWIFLNLHELRLYYGAYFVPRLTEAEVARFEASIASPRLREVHRDARFDIRILEILPRGGANEQAQRGERRRR